MTFGREEEYLSDYGRVWANQIHLLQTPLFTKKTGQGPHQMLMRRLLLTKTHESKNLNQRL